MRMRRTQRIYNCCLLVMITGLQLYSQDFILQGWYWDYPGTLDGYSWADTLENRAADLANAGFSYVWLPPLSRSSYGSNSNGYDPQDLYDLGEYGGGPTRFGARAEVNSVITAFSNNGIKAIADVIYNHRDGGLPENNPAVAGWVRNYTWQKAQNGDNPYPSDRFRLLLPIGGSSGRGSGTYYIKIKSASEHDKFFGKPYKIYVWTNKVGWQGLPDGAESEPNAGGGCGEPNNVITLGRNFLANIDGLGCKIDEFALTLGSSDYDNGGDNLYIVIANRDGNYSDHHPYEIWYNGSNIAGALAFQTYTDFSQLPSGLGSMNYLNFKPNGSPTQLAGDWDWPWFFYDYDQYVASTKTTLFEWTRWLWNDVSIRGIRMDAVKHFTFEFVGDLLDDLHDNGIDPGIVVGEYYDNSPATLKNWVNSVKSKMDEDTKSAIQPRVFDFALRQALKDACDSFGYDARNVFQSGMCDAAGATGYEVVTFAGNHDFRDSGQYIVNDPILAYAYLLSNNQIGLPCIFYKDYINGGLKRKIDALMAAHRAHIYGATQRDYLSRLSTPYQSSYQSGYPNTTLFFQIRNTPSGSDVLSAINYAGESLDMLHGLNMTGLNVNDVFIDVLKRSTTPASFVDQSGRLAIKLNARDYSLWVKGVQLGCSIFLEGAYDGALHQMRTDLKNAGIIPLTSPFGSDIRSVNDIPADVVDWILLELRTNPNDQAIASRCAFLRSDGRVVDLDGTTTAIAFNAPVGNYYLVVRHRNHLSIMSAVTKSLKSNVAENYDFTSDISQYYGQDAKLLETSPVSRFGLYAGDADGNDQVQNNDKNDYWKTQVGTFGYREADFNLNAQVQNDDNNDFWMKNVGKGSQVP